MQSNDSCDLQASIQLPISAPNVGAASLGQRNEYDLQIVKEERKTFNKKDKDS